MPYSLGEVAKLLNVDKSTIRNYEKQGLIHANRNEENAYREFSEEEVWILKEIRSFRNLGFSLDEIRVLLGNAPIRHVFPMLEEKKRHLIEQTRVILQQVETIGYVERNLYELHQTDQIREERVEHCYWKEFPVNHEQIDVDLPYVFASPLVSCDGTNHRIGYAVMQSDVSKCTHPLNQQEGVEVLLGCRCVTKTVALKTNDMNAYANDICEMVTYIQEHSLTCCGACLVRGIFTAKDDDGETTYYSKLCIPIESVL